MSGYSSTGRRLAAALTGMVAGAIAGLPVAFAGIAIYDYFATCTDCFLFLVALGPASMVLMGVVGAAATAKSPRGLGAMVGLAVGSVLGLAVGLRLEPAPIVPEWFRTLVPYALAIAIDIFACGMIGALIGWWLVARIGARSHDQDASEVEGPE